MGRLMFRDFLKASPAPGAVHVPTALGNERRKFRPTLPDGREILYGKRLPDGTRKLREMDSERSHIPFRWNSGALATLRPDQVPRFFGALTTPDPLETRTMKLSDLTAMQNRVDTSKANAWASGSIKSDRLPVVVRHSGENLIADGHHRLAGAWLRGDDMAQVKFLDLQPVSNAVKRAWRAPIDVRKVAPDQQMIFGWASIAERGGELVVDSQDDMIRIEDLEAAAYDYVLYSRSHGDMHETMSTGRLIESMVFTQEKQNILNINLGLTGWWTGFLVDNPEIWRSIKSGERPEFSIGGEGVRVPA